MTIPLRPTIATRVGRTRPAQTQASQLPALSAACSAEVEWTERLH
jgi:hypothetical protein